MDNENSLKTILNHLSGTAIYVIRQDDHRILYYNDRVKQVEPRAEVGAVCHELWKGMCGNCPLTEIGEAESHTTINDRTPSGGAVSITATKMAWEDKIPAYLIAVEPFVRTEKEMELDLERRKLAAVAAQMYPMVISVNLTQNNYSLIEYERYGTRIFPPSGNFDDLLALGISSIHPDFQKEFEEKFSREGMRKAFEAGKTEIYMEHRQMEEDGLYHWTSSHVIRIDNPYDDDVLEITLAKNIDAQKRMEEQSKNAFNFACESAGGITGRFLITDDAVYLLEASEKYFEYFGTVPEEHDGNVFEAAPKWAKKYIRKVCEAAKKRETAFLDFPYKRNGKDLWMQMQAACIGEQDGWPVYFGTLMDVTAQKQLEREREATYNSLPGGIVKILLDDCFSLEEANKTFYEMLEMGENDFGKGYLSHVEKEDRLKTERTIRRQVEEGKPISVEYRIRNKSGDLLWVHMEGKKVGRQGNIPVYLMVVLNITEQKRVQAELEKEQAKYRVAFETSADVLFEYVLETDVFYSYENQNDSDESVRTEKRVIVDYLKTIETLDIIYPEDLDAVREIMAGNIRRMEIRLRRPTTNEYAWFVFQGDAIREGGKVVRIIGTLRDINQIKENEDKNAYLQRICNFVCNKDYQLLAAIDLKTGNYHCAYLPEDGPFSRAPADGNYERECGAFIGGSVYKEDQEMAEREFRIENILGHLNQNNHEHNIFYRVLEMDGSIHWKSMTFSYFDRDKNTLLAAARDMQAFQDAKLKEKIVNQTLEVAIDRIYDKVIYLNLSKNKFEFIKSRGTYDDRKDPRDMEFESVVLPRIHPADRQGFYQKMNKNALLEVFAKGENYSYAECRRLGKDGEYHWTLTSAVRMEDNSFGDIMAMIMVSTIDDRKWMEQERQEFTAGVTALFEDSVTLNITKGTYVWHRSHKPWDGGREQGVYEQDSEKYSEAVLYPADRDAFWAAFSLDALRKRFAKGEKKIRRELRVFTPEGYRWVEITAVSIENMVSDDQKAILISRDIHELHMAKEERENANRRFASAANSLYDTIYEGDLTTGEMFIWQNQNDGEGLECVPAAFTLDQHFEKMEQEIIHPDYKAEYRRLFRSSALFSAFQRGQREVYLEAPRLMPNGSYRWYSMQAQCVMYDADRFRVMLYLKDLEDAKTEEESKRTALQDALELARQANHAKTDFLSRMSHDIRTPMNAIIGMAGIAAESTADTKKVEGCLKQIDVSAKFLLSLINDILDMSKIESGKMDMIKERFDLRALVKDITGVVYAQAYYKEQKLDVSVDDAVEEEYIGDVLRLNQVLMNLLSNALKYTGQQGKIALDIAVAEEHEGSSKLRFTIEDNGIGMSKEFLDRLFDPFEQEHAMGGRVFEGTGLGLSITQNLVRLMQGSISVKSTVGKGSCFTVVLPLERTSELSGSSSKAHRRIKQNHVPAEKEIQFKQERILLVEDNEINLEIARELLETKGLKVEHVENGKKAVECFMAAPDGYYQAILMDIRMPEMDGLEATQKIRAMKKEGAQKIPILAMTANAFQEEIEYARQIGMNDYLTKPIDGDILFGALAQAFYGKR